MSEYDYGNARIKVLKSKLLSRSELDRLTGSESLNGLISALTKTVYRKPVETALTRTSGLDCITESLHSDLSLSLGKVGKFYNGQAREMVSIVLRHYDIQNLKGILRGLGRQVDADEILSTMIPVGELDSSILEELVRSPDPRTVIDLLAMMGLIFAQPLIRLRSEHPGIGTIEMELALEQWFYQDAYLYLEKKSNTGRVLLNAMQLEADLVNLLTALRFVQTPEERKYLHEWHHIDEVKGLLVGPGKLSFEMLTQAVNQDTVEAATEIFSKTPYGPPLRDGLTRYSKSAMVSDIEKELLRFRLNWMSSQIIKDSLGIGVLLGYFALKINEINNIRWIAHGINLGLQAKDIQSELEYPP